MVHSGSRHLGLEVAKYYQEQAYHQCNGSDKGSIDAVIAQFKAESREKEIQKTVKVMKIGLRVREGQIRCRGGKADEIRMLDKKSVT